MADLLKRLREAGDDYTVAWGTGELYDEAAEEIESLRSAITAVVRESHSATEGIVALHILTTKWATDGVGGRDAG